MIYNILGKLLYNILSKAGLRLVNREDVIVLLATGYNRAVKDYNDIFHFDEVEEAELLLSKELTSVTFDLIADTYVS